MTGVRVSNYFGIVVRKEALLQRGVAEEILFQAMGVETPYDESENLLSFGPHFGSESAEEFTDRLRRIGLIYMEDFFVLWDDYPEWAELSLSLAPEKVN